MRKKMILRYGDVEFKFAIANMLAPVGPRAASGAAAAQRQRRMRSLVTIVGLAVALTISSAWSAGHVSPVSPAEMLSPEYSDALTKYLKQRDPEVWHKIAMGWNWDGGLAPLAWIVRQPECDRGTALLIYWRGGPGWYKQYGGREEVPPFVSAENHDLLKDIERRYLSGFYTRHEIAFDPHDDQGFDWTNEYKDVPTKHPIPKEMFIGTSGRTLSESCVFRLSRPRC